MQKRFLNIPKIKTSTWIKAFFVAACSVTLITLLTVEHTWAQKPTTPSNENENMRLDSFSADIVVNEDSTFEVTEEITGEFLRQRHGIFRFIPIIYEREGWGEKRIGLQVDSVQYNGDSVERDIYREGNSKVIKIGDPDETVTGPFTYRVTYRVDSALLTLPDNNRKEVYWNVTGSEWPVQIPDVSATVSVPDVSEGEFLAECYTGVRGSTEQNCNKTIEDGSVMMTADEFMTVAVSFPGEYITGPSWWQSTWWWLRGNWDYLTFIFPVIAGLVLWSKWKKDGRDPKEKHVVAPAFEPPEGLEPLEVGGLLDTKMHSRDFAAVIVGLAVKGYVKIREEESGLFSKKTYELEALKDADDDLSTYEREVYQALFSSEKTVMLHKRRSSLVKARKAVEKDMYERMTEQGYFVKNPKKVKDMYMLIGFLVGFGAIFLGIVVANTIGRPTVLISGICAAAVVFLFGRIMPKKTQEGAELFEQARSFKLFLSKAEKYRIQWQEKEGIFEEYLPYAIVFDVAEKWAGVFDIEEVQESTKNWYVPASGGFTDMGDLSSGLTSFAGTAATMSTPKSSGGSSGGGSSGGGFGGGGGGSW